METRKFLFKASIQGVQRDFVVTAPIENGAVITNRFCPQELLTGGLPLITAINGESIKEFISDCQKQVDAMGSASKGDSVIEIHIAGLMAAIMNHLNRCGRLIFGDLLIYMDCYSFLLSADGFSDDEIREMYPRVLRTIVELYPDYIKSAADLSPFKGSHLDNVLFNLSK